MADSRYNVFLLGDRTYDFAKKLVQFILPAFGTFYVTLSPVWDLPHSEKVSTTVLALCTFLGAVLGISNAQYNATGAGFDGKVMVQKQGPGENAPLLVTGVHYDGDSKQLQEKPAIKLKVEEVLPLAEQIDEFEEDEEIKPPPMNPATSSSRRNKLS